MLLLKEGFPEEDSLVLCTVTNIHYSSVFAKMDEYGSTGLIHISEIAPGRIRNIRDYVVEGKKVVCKVLRIDKKKGHIDLSLRRVNETQKRNKLNEIKLEQKAEKIIEQIAKNLKKDVKELYISITKGIFVKYPDLTSCFKDVVQDESILEKLGIEKDVRDLLIPIVKTRFKEEEVVISGTLKLQSFEPNGVDIIKKSLLDAMEVKDIKILYLGGAFKIEAMAHNYKDAEKNLDKAVQKALAFVEKGLGKGEFIRKAA